MEKAILHVSDWNNNDRYYEVLDSLLLEFKRRILEDGVKATWTWFMTQTSTSDEPDTDKPSRRVQDAVNMTLDTYFFDYTNGQESVEEWELED